MKHLTAYRRFMIASIAPLFFCCVIPGNAAEELRIYPLHPFEETDSVGSYMHKYKFFIIDSVQEGNKMQFSQIESYIKRNMDKDLNKFNKYIVMVYKESSKLTRNFRQTEFNRLMWHGQDIVYSFEWNKGIFASCEQFKDGRIIGTVRPHQ